MFGFLLHRNLAFPVWTVNINLISFLDAIVLYLASTLLPSTQLLIFFKIEVSPYWPVFIKKHLVLPTSLWLCLYSWQVCTQAIAFSQSNITPVNYQQGKNNFWSFQIKNPCCVMLLTQNGYLHSWGWWDTPKHAACKCTSIWQYKCVLWVKGELPHAN